MIRNVKPLYCAVRIQLFLLMLLICATSCEDPPSIRRAETKIAAFATALDAFRRDFGRYPTTAEGLAALTTRPASIPEGRWKGSYLGQLEVPQDPWGHSYAYRCPGFHNTNRYDLYSLGPDGVSKSGGDDADDIAKQWPKQTEEQ